MWILFAELYAQPANFQSFGMCISSVYQEFFSELSAGTGLAADKSDALSFVWGNCEIYAFHPWMLLSVFSGIYLGVRVDLSGGGADASDGCLLEQDEESLGAFVRRSDGTYD